MTRKSLVFSASIIAILACAAAATPTSTAGATDTIAQQAPPPPQQGPQITRIELFPAVASVPRGQQWPFQVRTFDANNNQIPTPPGVVLTVDSTVIGSFDPSGPQGLYRAPMDFRTTIRARYGSVSGTASVTITP